MDVSGKPTKTEQLGKREQIRSRLEKTRSEFHDLLDRLSSKDLDRPSVNPAWTIREVLYHMSLAPRNLYWDVWMIRRLSWVPKIPAGPFNWLNIIFTRRGGHNATKGDIAAAYDEGHQRAIKAWQSIKDDEWDKGVDYPDWDPMLAGFVTLERLFGYISLHFESHAKEIEDALKSYE